MSVAANVDDLLVKPDDLILVTGAGGFVGRRLVRFLQSDGFRRIRCLVRSSESANKLTYDGTEQLCPLEILSGNLLKPDDCLRATAGAVLIYHLAAGTGTKSFADAFLNTVVATRNLLDAALHHGLLRRFVNVSSITVYANETNARFGIVDESSATESHPELRCDPYAFAKIKQDELVIDYAKRFALPYVIVRPGVVYGPGKDRIHGRVGLNTFGMFMHLGGANRVPFTFVDNCAEAIAMAGLKKGIGGQVFNVVDDNLPSSREFLKLYKRQVRSFRSLFIPHWLSYILCFLWEKYAFWSNEQLPPAFNRKIWATTWKAAVYSNRKIKGTLGWTPRMSTSEGLNQYFTSCRENLHRA